MNEYVVVFDVLLTTPKDVFDFAYEASQIPHDVSVDAIHGSYAVEARSVTVSYTHLTLPTRS